MESVVCLRCLTISYTGTYHTMDAGQNRGVGGGWRNFVGGFRGGAIFAFEVFGGIRVSLVVFEVDGALKFG